MPRILLVGIALGIHGAASGQSTATARVLFKGSYKEVPVAAAAARGSTRHAHLLRAALRADETSAAMTFEVALRMPNFAALQERLARGEQISRGEMESTYYPSASDYARVIAWIKSQGLEVTRTDADRLGVFGRGSVAAVAQAFQVNFGRVTTDDGDYTSALTAPSLPADLAAAVVGIHGLQPHLRFHSRVQAAQIHTDAGTISAGYFPAQIATNYNATSTGLTGAGQTIAIVSAGFATSSDLQTFWTAAGITNSGGHIQNITVGTGPGAGDTEVGIEAALDVEWASSLAPGAVIRVYGANFNDPNFFDEILQQIFADLPGVPSIHQVSISYGNNEVGTDRDYVIILSQYAANLASAGVSIFCASGDNGSVEDGVLQVSVPTSDPNITGVGGTFLAIDTAGNLISETGWTESGGGVSQVFARPSWQTGIGVTPGSMRLVPDVAAVAAASAGAVVIVNGISQAVSGTSWSTPIWAAFCALLNQSRASVGLGPLGNLNPRLYPLVGTSVFRDITSGNNGNFNCTTGYDLVTGLGSPNVGALTKAPLTASAAPVFYSQLGNQIVTVGQPATFFAELTAAPPVTLQWQRLAAGTSAWVNLTDNAIYSGTATNLLVVNGTTLAMNLDQFQCVGSNSQGSAVSSPADVLTVNPFGVTTFAGWPESWGTADGTGWAARFEYPGSIREDASGNLYVADARANTIRKLTSAGVVTTIAGTPGVTGAVDGPAAAAQFDAPAGVAIDATGTIYVADDGNLTIRKITPGGVVSTLAGLAGQAGHVDAVGSAARFGDPQDLALDAAGNIYVADGTGNRIRKVAPDGTVTTFAGSGSTGSTNGTGTAASFHDPVGVAVDGAGNVFVADAGGNRIRKVTSAGVVSLYAGQNNAGSADGSGLAGAAFSSPSGVAVDAVGNVYVADTGNSTVRLITPSQQVSTLAGLSLIQENIDGPAPSSRLSTPSQVAVDPSGVLFVADTGNSTIRRIVQGTLLVPQILTSAPAVTVNVGQSATFPITVNGSVPLSDQWQQLLSGASTWVNLADGPGVSGSASPTLTIIGATVALFGSQYQCIVTNNEGSAISGAATLSVLGAPVISTVPVTRAVQNGTAQTLTVAALGSALTYQWKFNGAAIVGATSPSYTIPSFGVGTVGTYSVLVSNSFGSSTATVATLNLASARLVNLSASSNSTAGSGILAAGFIVGGTGSKQVLLRGIGPTLTAFGLTGALPDPSLTWFNSVATSLANDTGWGGTAALTAAFTASGAFPLSASSADSALIETAPAGGYTIQVAGAKGDSGNALAEIYDLDAITAPARLINLSCRSAVTGSTTILTAGFFIGGSGTETVLIRGVGPTLANFGVTGFLANPVITLVPTGSSTAIASNAGWNNSAALSAIFSQVSAFALNPGSNDAAMVMTLAPGGYTVQVTGANGSSGVALVEIYEVPQ
jgi:sugar lactone lactonase YvrE